MPGPLGETRSEVHPSLSALVTSEHGGAMCERAGRPPRAAREARPTRRTSLSGWIAGQRFDPQASVSCITNRIHCSRIMYFFQFI